MDQSADHAEIAEVVRLYVEGMCQNDPAKLRRAMHEKACSIGAYQGGLEWASREEFIALVAEAVTVPDPAPWHAIESIAITGDVAVVKVGDIFAGERYDDVLTLLRHDGHWVIVAKVFHLRPAS